jgi:glycine betaine transporter
VEQNTPKSKVDWTVFGLSGGIISIFVIAALINMDAVSTFVYASFDFSTSYFGAFWQVLATGMFFMSLYLAISKYGQVKLGRLEKPEIKTFTWVAMIVATTLAGGGVFWSAAEPLYHFMSVPPMYPGIEAGTIEAVAPAMAISYLHWGFNAWALVAPLGAIVLLWAHYHKGLPLKPRTLIYPLVGEKLVMGPLGTAVDVFCIISVAAGTIGPIGMLAMQMTYFFERLFSIPDTYATQLVVLMVLVAIYTVSAVTGVHKGIKWLSSFNANLAIILGFSLLLIGPGRFIVNTFLTSMSLYVMDYIPLSLYRGSEGWLGWWSVFYWGWFGGYGPVLAVFMARISRGRTIRDIVLLIGVIAPVVTNLWFTMLGGSGLFFELQTPGLISGVLDTAGLPGVLYEIINQMPMAGLLIPIYMILIIVFLATTGDSIAYTISVSVTGDQEPNPAIRVFWGVAMGVVAAILLRVGGLEALQSWIILTFVPVSFVLASVLITAPKVGRLAYEEFVAEAALNKSA